ncbi:MAG: Eco57I restriction-modification methylase domain-containing protein [Chitinophagales bacterium]|nr:Eco57I restriction-modification methylase domain-containing protein [Chitinophagales bacterium]
MSITELTPRQVLSKAWLKQQVEPEQLDDFKGNLLRLLENIDPKESEEHLKNKVADFLKDTWYKPHFEINTKGRNDLVIHLGKTSKEPVGVIFEVKKPGSPEMVKKHDLNRKAMQELVLYYLRERVDSKNNDLRYLIVTDIWDWYIFNAAHFEKLFYGNKALLKEYDKWKTGQKTSTNTDLFYNEVAKPFIAALEEPIEFSYLSIKDLGGILRSKQIKDENKLIPIYKVLSPQHLLKQPFANDHNQLNGRFYQELLHIIGLEDKAEGSKRVIRRKPEGKRDEGSLIENTINILETEDRLRQVPNLSSYGENDEERIFNVALELCITWINRILFLKLLEAQLIRYHNKDQSYRFVDFATIPQYDELNKLFFQVLAVKPEERKGQVKTRYRHVPYLNSSLFEINELENATIRVNSLDDGLTLPILGNTVLKDNNHKSLGKSGESRNTLRYLLDFLDAYDFASESEEGIKKSKKDLINAAVLGLIFEKINGYKDGSFFTPGFITMYMCRETLRKAVVQKFNEKYGWTCEEFDDLKDKLDFSDKKVRVEANALINSLKICDPAVGSGHFLVSALNELISIKSDLRILCHRNGNRMHGWKVVIDHDELNITSSEDEKFFNYHLNKAGKPYEELQQMQEALFHEKQTIIENCLFGADINPNSVKICRLRLWIELLKNAYYTKESDYTELETLPNIDINIKQGNTLISRFSLSEDLSEVFKRDKYSLRTYRNAVEAYKSTPSKTAKEDLIRFIAEIKEQFKTAISSRDPLIKKIAQLRGEYELLKHANVDLFGEKKLSDADRDLQMTRLQKLIAQREQERDEIRNNKMYQNALEWRFDFPEVLDEQGAFIGFDVVIGNPPYIALQKMGEASVALGKQGYQTFERTGDIYCLFYERGMQILRPNGLLNFITSNKWMRAGYGESTRNYFAEQTNPLVLVDFGGFQVFDSATVDTNILMLQKSAPNNELKACTLDQMPDSQFNMSVFVRQNAQSCTFAGNQTWVLLGSIEQKIKHKIETIGIPLKDWDINIYRGILTGYNEAFIIDGKKRAELIAEDPKSDEIIRPILRGRDIKRYGYEFADLWIIATFPSLKINIDLYPAVKQHLLSFGYDRLKQTGDAGARKRTHNQWFETQDSISYWEDFNKQKITYIEIMTDNPDEGYDFPSFSFDTKKCIALNTAYIMTGNVDELKYILGILNSKLGRMLVKNYAVQLQQRQFRMLNQCVVNFPIPKKDVHPIAGLVDKIIKEKNLSQHTLELERKVDVLVSELFELSDEEIAFIELQ